jgi:hypothetical protein
MANFVHSLQNKIISSIEELEGDSGIIDLTELNNEIIEWDVLSKFFWHWKM